MMEAEVIEMYFRNNEMFSISPEINWEKNELRESTIHLDKQFLVIGISPLLTLDRLFMKCLGCLWNVEK